MAADSLPAMMRVPRFTGQGRIAVMEQEVPRPGAGQLLIKIKANALCGSERGQFRDGAEVVPGHEAAGIVVAAGPETQVPPGTAGVIFLMDFCGACRSCRLGLTNQCLAKRADMGFNRDGGYAPYELVSERIFFPVDDDIPLTEATMLLDVMGTSSHAIGRAQRVHGDIETVAITGAGPVGLGVLAMARLLLGPSIPILIGEVVPYRLELAARLGGIPIDLKGQSLEEGVAKHVAGGIDVAIDTSGKSTARRACLDVLAKRGVLVCVGHGEGLALTVSPDLIAPERTILGSEYFCFSELPATLQLLRAHRAYLRQLITHRFPVSELKAAFELFFGGNTGKVVIEQ